MRGLDFVVIDYLQRIKDRLKNRARYEEVSQIVQNLKSMAKELRIPVLVTAQLGRGIEGRQRKEPMLSDLRESGDIEAEADLVMFLHREEIYDPKPDNMGKAKLIIAKHRQDAVGVIDLIFEKEFTRFRENDSHLRNLPEGWLKRAAEKGG